MSQAPFLPTFVELPPFERFRKDYLNDDEYRLFQAMLLSDPEAGDVIRGTGGLRKVRFEDKQRGKGKRGGLRVIYYYWVNGFEFLLFTLYSKDEMDDMTTKQRDQLKTLLEFQLAQRKKVLPT